VDILYAVCIVHCAALHFSTIQTAYKIPLSKALAVKIGKSMKVFVSWSGCLSKDIAEAIRIWLPAVLQAVKPYFTPDDIEKGARWSSEIADELESSKLGIFCITRDNLNSPWIIFEAGAISKVVGKGSVCPILFDVENSDISGPLGQFQSTAFQKDDFLKLIKTINTELGDSKLPDATLIDVFNMWWPKLEDDISKIIKDHEKKEKEVSSELRSERDILEEVLGLVRMISKIETRQENREQVKTTKISLSDLIKSKKQHDLNNEPDENMNALQDFIKLMDKHNTKNNDKNS
jgi:GTPase SAR1 family protein